MFLNSIIKECTLFMISFHKLYKTYFKFMPIVHKFKVNCLQFYQSIKAVKLMTIGFISKEGNAFSNT